MNKTTHYDEDDDVKGFNSASNAAIGLGLFFPPLFFLGAACRAAGEIGAAQQRSNARRADTDDEADEIAEAWRRNRGDDERSIDIRVSLPDGGSVRHHYSVDDED